MSDWLELELAERLAPVRAPDALWACVNQGVLKTSDVRAPRPKTWAWVGAAIVFAATLAVTLAVPSPSLSQLAAAELAKSQPADFHSADPREITGWLRANAGVEVSIPPGSRVQLSGARTIERRGGRIGEVLYRVDGRDAVLLIARSATMDAPERHGQSTWKAHGEVYALAYSAPMQSNLACRLCHVD
jgi:hypothetical protein